MEELNQDASGLGVIRKGRAGERMVELEGRQTLRSASACNQGCGRKAALSLTVGAPSTNSPSRTTAGSDVTSSSPRAIT